MPSPFPGMDPYLEDPEVWPGFHTKLISEIQTLLSEELHPQYLVDIEQRIYIMEQLDEDRMDVRERVADAAIVLRSSGKTRLKSSTAVDREPLVILEKFPLDVREKYLVIRDANNRKVVTVLEVLSPTNKAAGSKGRKEYLLKRKSILSSSTNLVEIDLLRKGRPMVADRFCEYCIYVSEVQVRPKGSLWPIRLDERLPRFAIPLRREDRGVLDLQTAFEMAYDRAFYKDKLDYRHEPFPPLPPAWRKWAKSLLAKRPEGT